MRLRPSGDRAVLVELSDADERRRLDAALRTTAPDGMLEHVPAARTVLVTVVEPARLPGVVAALRSITLPPSGVERPTSGQDVLEIGVTYDGEDLADVAAHLGCDVREVVTRHTGQVWQVEFTGFAPGFGYLIGDRGGLHVPRRTTPRTRIPTGAVGLAGDYSGVYPRASPGGWQLIGRTDLEMWDARREPPAVLEPGRRVQFVEVGSGGGSGP